MIFYILYRIGHAFAMALPLKVSYGVACAIADIYYFLAGADRRALANNLRVVLNNSRFSDMELEQIGRKVFRNFAKYLVDFFRFSKMDLRFIKKFIKIEGRSNLDLALSRGKGVILLSAHIGNWELGGFVVAKLGYPTNAVVLAHQNKRINDFFTRQRSISKLKPIEIGMGLRTCYSALKNNSLLAVLGDRDFSKSGIYVDFFGRKTLMPKGPAAFAHRIGSAIVPCFMIRCEDDSFKFFFEEPIFPDPGGDEEKAVRELAGKYLAIMESYIKRYPTQWYVFREVWNNNDSKLLRPDTII